MNESLNVAFTNTKEFVSYSRAVYGKHTKIKTCFYINQGAEVSFVKWPEEKKCRSPCLASKKIYRFRRCSYWTPKQVKCLNKGFITWIPRPWSHSSTSNPCREFENQVFFQICNWNCVSVVWYDKFLALLFLSASWVKLISLFVDIILLK